MERKKIIVSILAIFVILSSLTIATLTIFPTFIPVASAESNAPPPNGTTNKTWYIDTTDQVFRANEMISTVDIQINSSGAMDWINVSAEVNGSVAVNDGGFFNVTNSTILLTGDLIIKGLVNFYNVTLIMNSTHDGEYMLQVDTNATFNVDYSNITAYNTWTPINLDNAFPGPETWGYHYNFTVYGNMSMSHCDVSYVWGRVITINWRTQQIEPVGGIVIAPTNNSVVTITNSNLTKMETCGLNLQGWTHDITISNNHIFDIANKSTWYGFGIYAKNGCNATVNYNDIEYCTASGIYLDLDANCTIHDNNITYSGIMPGWTYTGGILSWASSSKVSHNNISDNFGEAGSILMGFSTDCVFEHNTLMNNNNTGIRVVSSNSIVDNNYIKNNTGVGIEISSWMYAGIFTVIWGSGSGYVRNNTIEINNHTGITIDNNFWGLITYMTTKVDNNTINNNNLTGIYALNCNPPITNNSIFNNHQDGIWLNQASDSFVYNNTINNNHFSGLYTSTSSPTILKNDVNYNNWSGLEADSSSSPDVLENYFTNNNRSGIDLSSNSDANIEHNEIQDNNWSGISSLGSSPTIRNNNLTSNDQNGIYIYRSGPRTILIRDNQMTYNLWNGIESNSSSPIIRTNNITNNTKNGIRLNNSSPSIYDNNDIRYNQENGVACYAGSSPAITNDIRYNTLNGIYCNASSPRVIDALVANNSANGVFADAGSSPSIENSTIAGNTVHPIRASANSHPSALNSTFDDTSVFFEDTVSTLTVEWFLHIKTIDPNNALIGTVDIWVDSTTQAPSSVWVGNTKFDGLRKWIHIKEYVKTDNNGDNDGEDLGEITTWTPHNITADKFGYRLTYVDPEPTLDHTQWVTIKLAKNIAPGPAMNIRPDVTHSLNPVLTWDASIDPELQPVTYWVNIGTWPNGTNVIFNQSTIYTNYTLSFVPEDYGTEGNSTYYVMLYADDQDGGFSKVNDIFYLVNHAPTQPGINITPRNPNILINSLTCHINTSSIDLDGDEINYTYRWYKNGLLQNDLLESNTKALSDTITTFTDGVTFKHDDVWMCRVTSNDGFVASTRDEDSVEFINLKPITTPIKELKMDEDSVENDWINLSNVFEDPDPPSDGTPFKFWVEGNVNITVTIDQNGLVDIIPDPNWNGQETITFYANDTGTKIVQVSAEALITVLPVNDDPSLVSVRNQLIDESKTITFIGNKGALQDKTFLTQIVATDIDLERGEDDTLIFTVNSTRVLVITDLLDPLKVNLSFTPDNTDVLQKKFFIKVELRDIDDTTVDDYVDIMIEIRNINDPPSIVSFTHMDSDKTYDVIESGQSKYIEFLEDDNSAKEDQWYNLTINGVDPDPGDVIAYDSDDSRILIKPDLENKLSGIVTFKPTQAEVGTLEFNITAVDSEGATDTVLVRIQVENTNSAPIAKILKPTRREFDVGETIDFEGDVSDKDLPQDSHTFTWTSEWDGLLGDQLSLSDIELSTGIHEITFTVKDAAGREDTATITLTVGGADTDRDGLPDSWEEQYFDGLEYDAEEDPDNDRLTNLEEYILNSDPLDPDSPVSQSKKSDSDDIDEGLMIGIVIAIIIIIVVLIMVFLLMRKKKATSEEAAPAGVGIPTPPIPRDKVGYHARPVPTLDELFPEGVSEEDLRIGTPQEDQKEKEKEKKPEDIEDEKKSLTGIGLPPEELRKELRRKKPSRKKGEEGVISVPDDETTEKVVTRPEADDELIFERSEGAAEFRPGEAAPQELDIGVPDSPFAGAGIKEIEDTSESEEPIFMEREPEDLRKVYGEDEDEDLEDEEE